MFLFAGAQAQTRASVSMETKADLEALAKTQNPVVGYFDPLNLADGEFWEQSNAATIGWLRHAEMKHVRPAKPVQTLTLSASCECSPPTPAG